MKGNESYYPLEFVQCDRYGAEYKDQVFGISQHNKLAMDIYRDLRNLYPDNSKDIQAKEAIEEADTFFKELEKHST